MSYGKIQKLMRKTREGKIRNAEFYVFDISPVAEQPANFHTKEELSAEQRVSTSIPLPSAYVQGRYLSS
jgi:hypothetical protein